MLLTSCGNDKTADKSSSFELKGTLSNAAGGETIFLEELAPTGKKVIDSALVDDKGNFAFTHASPAAGFYRVKVNEQNFAMLVLDSSQKISMKGDIRNLGNTYTTEGSEDTKVFLEFNSLGRSIQQRTDSMQQSFQSIVGTMKMDSVHMDSISKSFEPVYNKMIDEYQTKVAALVTKNKTSLASLAGIDQLNPDKYLDLYKELDASLSAKYSNSKYLGKLHGEVASFSRLMKGSKAPDITGTNPEGKTLSLSSFKGKIVMIDFWASWCGPCRKENPNVVRLYNKYHAKGFDIFGVSLDDDKDRWVAAIKKDGLIWNHVSELKGWQSAVCGVYGVDAIPQTFLVDKEGNIIDKGLRGKELEDKLAELLGK